MSQLREVLEISNSMPAIEGAGVRLRRAFGFRHPERYDPFLLLDDFRAARREDFIKGFPWHPHRGIETITYVLAGKVAHGDSLGSNGVISSGDVQWMTAGSGIIHQEMPEGDGNGVLEGFQLWLNLPASEKMCAPRYRDISAATIPAVRQSDGISVRIICGQVGGVTGPIHDITTGPEYLDVTIPAGANWRHPVRRGRTAIAYVFAGSGRFSATPAPEAGNHSLILFGDGDELTITAGTKGLRILLMTGRPLREPIAWQGPIVMNSEEQLEEAFREFRAGTFLRHKPQHTE